MHIGTNQLETKRLILRRFTSDDVSAVYHNWCHDHRVTPYLCWHAHKNESVTKNYIDTIVERYHRKDMYHWVIERKDDHMLIGEIEAAVIDEVTCKIGYVFSYYTWSHGYASEAAAAVRDYALYTIGLKQMVGDCVLGNEASANVLKRIGLHYDHSFNDIDHDGKICIVDRYICNT